MISQAGAKQSEEHPRAVLGFTWQGTPSKMQRGPGNRTKNPHLEHESAVQGGMEKRGGNEQPGKKKKRTRSAGSGPSSYFLKIGPPISHGSKTDRRVCKKKKVQLLHTQKGEKKTEFPPRLVTKELLKRKSLDERFGEGGGKWGGLNTRGAENATESR